MSLETHDDVDVCVITIASGWRFSITGCSITLGRLAINNHSCWYSNTFVGRRQLGGCESLTFGLLHAKSVCTLHGIYANLQRSAVLRKYVSSTLYGGRHSITITLAFPEGLVCSYVNLPVQKKLTIRERNMRLPLYRDTTPLPHFF